MSLSQNYKKKANKGICLSMMARYQLSLITVIQNV